MWIFIAILVVLIIWAISVYNSLVTLRMNVSGAFAQIDTVLKRRFDLIPNLVETVKGYAKHESETLEKVITARNSFASANSIEDKSKANNELTNSLKSIFALSESYPDLKANENFLHLQSELTSTEDTITSSRQSYNSVVEKYNTKIITFPDNIIASIFKFHEEKFFETNEEEREAVKVSF